MRILLTGTSGQVGAALRLVLQDHDEVLAPQRAQFDLSKPETLVDRLEVLKPDLIINPAAYTAVDRAEEEVELTFRVNAEAPGMIAQWAARHNVPLVHFSTDYVFNGLGDRPWREEDPCAALSVYGKTKYQGELAVREAGGAHLVVRTSWVYASEGKNFFRTIIRLAGERPELRIVDDQIGAPTSARSIADAIKALLPADLSKMTNLFSRAGGLVHIANSGSTSWFGFASEIVSGLRERKVNPKAHRLIPIATKDYPTKAFRPSNSRLDLTRASDVFGINMPSWRQALAVELDEFVRNEGIHTRV
jgi:dTDP-4-dehydrorhamnose reductase